MGILDIYGLGNHDNYVVSFSCRPVHDDSIAQLVPISRNRSPCPYVE